MNITILTYGSRGDVQPFVALAVGLQRAGHTVLLAAPARFAGFVAQYTIPFAPLPGDPEVMSARLNEAGGNAYRAVKSMAAYAFSIAAPVARAAFAACDGADMIVHSFLFTTGAHSLARQRGISDVSVQPFPMFAPTRAFPNVALARVPSGRWSYFTHWFASQVFWHVGNMGYRRLRAAAPDVFDLDLCWPFDASRPPQTPLIFAYSPTVLPRPDDWSAPNIHVVGYFFLDDDVAYQPPVVLSRFLEAGAPPVCVTFGSMVNREATRVQGIVLEALAASGNRAVVLTGWGDAGSARTSENVLFLDAVPHTWLFPRCKAVIHHGGAGTTAAGLRAGIPNIIVPHAADQPFWGKRIHAIGAGPAPVPVRELTLERLLAALAAVENPSLISAARAVGGLIRAENGVGAAIRLIEQGEVRFTLKKRALQP